MKRQWGIFLPAALLLVGVSWQVQAREPEPTLATALVSVEQAVNDCLPPGTLAEAFQLREATYAGRTGTLTAKQFQSAASIGVNTRTFGSPMALVVRCKIPVVDEDSSYAKYKGKTLLCRCVMNWWRDRKKWCVSEVLFDYGRENYEISKVRWRVNRKPWVGFYPR